MSSSDPEFSRDVSPEKARRDPQWLPSDTEMLNWIEKKHALISPHCGPQWKVWVLHTDIDPTKSMIAVEEIGWTLREAVEKGMRRLS